MDPQFRAFLESIGLAKDASEEDAAKFAASRKLIGAKLQEPKKPVDAAAVRAEEQRRISDLIAIGENFNLVEEARAAVNDGTTVDSFRAVAMEKIAERQGNRLDNQENASELGLSKKEVRSFSFLRAIKALADPSNRKAQEDAKFEFEVSQAAAAKAGHDVRGIYIPFEVLAHKRDLSEGGTGQYIVDTQLDTASFVDVLHNAMLAKELGVQILNFNGPVDIPKKTATGTGYWIATEGADITAESQPTLSQIAMTRKTVGAYTDITRKLLKDASMGAENLVRNDLALVLALMIDSAVFNGTGANGQPTGILKATGINSFNWATANSPTWAELVQMETEVLTDNALLGSLKYVSAANISGYAKSTPKVSGTAVMMKENNQINGYDAAVTNQLSAGQAIFGNFNDCLLAEYGGIDITVDPYSNSTNGSLRIVAFQDCDVAVRHAESFCEAANA